MTTLCAWCDDMVKTDGQWIKDAGRYGEITGTPGLSHSICPNCFNDQNNEIKRFQKLQDMDDMRVPMVAQER